MVRDKENEKAHRGSAQIACEAAGAIKTVAALTREDDCCRLYSESLDGPLRNGRKAAFRTGLLYGLAQATTFWVIALVFWYGSRLVSTFDITPFAFFLGLMVR